MPLMRAKTLTSFSDSTVVVVESIYEEREKMPGQPMRASIVGTRHVAIALSPDAITFTTTDPTAPDLEFPAEALIRLVYGRLDPDHAPPTDGSQPDLDELRRAFLGA